MTDARFEDGADSPLRVIARDGGDVPVVSSLLQDAVVQSSDLRFDRKARRFAALVNRFRWEDADAAKREGRAFERVRCLMVVEDVLAVRSNGFDRSDRDLVLSILSASWEAGAEGAGRLTLTLAGDGALALEVEALEIRLEDVARPHRAVSGRAPDHALD